MEIKLTEFEKSLIGIFCNLYELYEKHTGSVIVHAKTVKMYEKLKKLQEE